jgi:DAPG hydrolase PhiG domain
MADSNWPKPDPTTQALPLLLSEAKLMLSHEYLPLESGYAINAEGMHYVAASTWIPNCTTAMID